MSDSKDYLFFNRRESKNSLFGDNEEKRTSYQHNDIEFLNALTKRKISTAQPIRKTTTMLSRVSKSYVKTNSSNFMANFNFVLCMELILEGGSEHIAHARRKIGLFGLKISD